MKTYTKPSELYHDACLEICTQIKETGFKFIKSQKVIKKQTPLFIFEICFESSHLNRIDSYVNEGHVSLQFGCFIFDKKTKQDLFYISPRTLMGLADYELFAPGGKINTDAINEVVGFINDKFIPVVKMIASNPQTLLELYSKQPKMHYDNYLYICEKELFLFFERTDLLADYDAYMEKYKQEASQSKRQRWKKYLLTEIDFSLSEMAKSESIQLLEEISKLMKKRAELKGMELLMKSFDYLIHNKYDSNQEWLVEYYMFIVESIEFIQDKDIKQKIGEQMSKLHPLRN
ncbi:hypothetical protein AJL11_01970 [Listeria monocytogenes]|uniref:DUF4304 domain-containing protein n=1 Tax=Listeria monocytogenes TaxID=1639 RepID=A0A823ISL9_LISMN|nr:hypothetical protein [Listeria monocytogenes]EAC6872495.1 hypothetical protein [Listeria monocytogenes]EAD1933220.1 hypothetical protein [Listeria monocytogenes]EAF5831088.1 hypothetical protein [Listeria monocytogenes]EAG9220366.1 hypothetical protein [Listeria monocytogenes]EAG9352230.1 hypothetical protein [Listeria monocytogenes]